VRNDLLAHGRNGVADAKVCHLRGFPHLGNWDGEDAGKERDEGEDLGCQNFEEGG